MRARVAITFCGSIALISGCDTEISGLDLSAMSEDADPCQDFYAYACGGYIASHPLSNGAAQVVRFADAFYAAVPHLQTAVDRASAPVQRFVAACTAAPFDAAARTTVKQLIQDRPVLSSLAELAPRAVAQRNFGSGTFFDVGVELDPADPTRSLLSIWEGGVELRDRSYYLDPAQEDVRASYRQHITNLSRLVLGDPLDADAVLRVETAMATAFREHPESDPVESFYHLMPYAEAVALAPSFPWDAFFEQLGFEAIDRLDVTDPDYLRAIEQLLTTTPLAEIDAYMSWQLIQDTADSMDQPVLDADFDFWNIFVGRARPLPRDWSCFLGAMDRFPKAVAHEYVHGFFDDRVLETTRGLTENIRSAFGARLDGASWIDDATRSEAKLKLEQMRFNLGHPDTWSDEQMKVEIGATLLEIDAARAQAGWKRAAEQLKQPYDPELWAPVLEDNAFYDPTTNDITVGMLMFDQPFWAQNAPRARNLGALGVIFGHELTHGFDDSGRHFDGRGLLRNWWTADAGARFQERSECLVDAFDAFTVSTGEHVNGRRTLGENIADLGGIETAFRAMYENGDPGSGGDGFEPEQVFFLAYAQTWCGNESPALTSARLITDPHAPEKARVNVALSNVPEFATAFDCKKGDPMVRSEPCAVW